MIKSIRLKNFKSHRDSKEVPFAPLTVLIGANNTGKSAIIHAILALHQTLLASSATARLITRGRYVDLGGFYDIVHGGGDGRRSPQFTIEVSRDVVPAPPSESSNFRAANRISITFGFKKRTNAIRVGNATFSDDEGKIFECSEDGSWSADGIPEDVRKQVKIRFKSFLPSAIPKERSLREFDIKDRKTIEVLGAILSVDMQSESWRHFFGGDIVHVEPLRAHVPFYGGIGERASYDSRPGGENVLRVLADKSRLPTGGQNTTLLDAVNNWMESRLNVLSNIRLESLDKAGHVLSLIADDPGGQQGVNVAAMGEGISQVLPIVATVLRSYQDDCLLIEQPELHLHPKLQADLSDLFIDIVGMGKRQLVVETHSEHLVLRLRTHVAKGHIDPKDVAILYVEKDRGVSRVRRLNLNGHGHFDDWPKGYFDDAYREAMNLAMAQPTSNA